MIEPTRILTDISKYLQLIEKLLIMVEESRLVNIAVCILQLIKITSYTMEYDIIQQNKWGIYTKQP